MFGCVGAVSLAGGNGRDVESPTGCHLLNGVSVDCDRPEMGYGCLLNEAHSRFHHALWGHRTQKLGDPLDGFLVKSELGMSASVIGVASEVRTMVGSDTIPESRATGRAVRGDCHRSE